jgi:hypothetical protein
MEVFSIESEMPASSQNNGKAMAARLACLTALVSLLVE